MTGWNKRKKGAFLLIGITVWLLFVPLSHDLVASESGPREDRFNREYIFKFGDDFKEVVTAPKDWGGNDFLRLSAVLGAGALLYLFDQDIQDWVQKQRTSTSNDFSKVVTNFGDGFYLCGFMAALYGAGELSRKNSLRRTALLSFESFLTTSAFVIVIKSLTGRVRPEGGEGSHSFHPFSLRTIYNALPSGHSATAWAVATTIADQTESVPVDVLAYSFATLAALSRINDNEHWASDVFVGSALGYFVAKKICSVDRGGSQSNFNCSFQFSRQSQAVTLSLAF